MVNHQTPPPSYEAVTGIPGAQQKETNPFIWYPHQPSAPPPTEYNNRSAYNPSSYPASSNLSANNAISQQLSNDRPGNYNSAAYHIFIYFIVIGVTVLVLLFIAMNSSRK